MKYTPEMLANLARAEVHQRDANELVLKLMQHPGVTAEQLVAANKIAVNIKAMMNQLKPV